MDTEALVEAGSQDAGVCRIHRCAGTHPRVQTLAGSLCSVSMEGGMQQREMAVGKPMGTSETQIKVIWVLYKIGD